jgi:hypothetical protein
MSWDRWKAFSIFGVASLFVVTFFVPVLAFLKAPAGSPSPWWNVAAMSAIPDDGVPHLHLITAKQSDGWNSLPDRFVGHLYLIREPDANEVRAFLPHCRRGASIRYDSETKVFRSMCWDISFDLQGRPLQNTGLSEMIPVPIKVEADLVLARME